jgi:SAM-dependent methyltransferase
MTGTASNALWQAIRATGLPRLVLGAVPRHVRNSYVLWKIAANRARHARVHLKGEGIEIGAMHFPLKVARDVRVRYVDYLTREENLRRFPHLDARRLVTPDHIEDGFKLAGIPRASQDFVIANHVLEHSPDPIGTLETWWHVIRPGGVLYLTVPLAAHCFDRGRSITELQHMVEDRSAAADESALATRNLEHYEEWVTISLRNIAADEGTDWSYATPDEAKRHVQQLMSERAEIHFHTFTEASFGTLVRHFSERRQTPSEVLDVRSMGGEVLGILRRSMGLEN